MPSFFNSAVWSAVQRFLGMAISFISNIVLARLLCPDDFGAVAMVMVFVGLADVLVDGGLGNALIQKKDVNKEDIHTVFSTNFTISVLLFSLLFLCSGLVESYVKIEGFSLFLRVEAIIILIRAFYVVNFSLLNRKLNFKALAAISLTSQTAATVSAIVLALLGCGIWSLIIKNIILDLVACVLYAVVIRVPFRFGFKKESFRELFSFGAFVSLANMIENVFSNFLSFILGKNYSVEKLGYYNQAHSLEQIPVYSTTMVLNQVLFPFLSKSQDDTNSIKGTLRQSTLVVSFFVFPLMAFLVFFAEPVIVFIYSSKWLPAVPYFRILCVYGFTNFIYHSNRNVLKSIGASRLLFYTQLISTLVGISFVFIGLRFSIIVMLLLVVSNSIISLFIIGGVAGKKINYPIHKQITDVFPNLIYAVLSSFVAFLVINNLTVSNLTQIVFGFIICCCIYLFLEFILRSTSYGLVLDVVKKRISIKRSKSN